MNLFEKHQETLENAIKANRERTFFAAFPENPKAYGMEASEAGKLAFQNSMNKNFEELLQENPKTFAGDEVSPFLQLGLGIKYPIFDVPDLVENAKAVQKTWAKTNPQTRAGILIEALDQTKNRFFEIAHATMHTTGQAFVMSFQASGPHAADRALEAIAMGYEEMTRFPEAVTWVKPMGKYDLKVQKKWRTVSKGIALTIGCSTFPTWNTVPGMFASLITGNPVIVKPHPKAVLPIAIFIAELQKVLKANNFSPNVCQLAVDQAENLITRDLARHPEIKIIDYTGGSEFGNWLEGLAHQGKEIFTEKAGVNSVIIDSTNKLKGMVDNLAFSVSLYSGQMCTAPQNFFIPENGIETEDGHKSFDEVAKALKNAISGIVSHPKMGTNILGSIQNDNTLERVEEVDQLGADCILESEKVVNAEFENARSASPKLLEIESNEKAIFENELFGPISLLIKTKNTEESIALAKEMAQKHGAISCAAYSTNEEIQEKIADEMAEAFTPVSFNLMGGIFVNQNAAFSDFHVTGGNPAGNASFTDPSYVNRRFIWVGQRYL